MKKNTPTKGQQQQQQKKTTPSTAKKTTAATKKGKGEQSQPTKTKDEAIAERNSAIDRHASRITTWQNRFKHKFSVGVRKVIHIPINKFTEDFKGIECVACNMTILGNCETEVIKLEVITDEDKQQQQQQQQKKKTKTKTTYVHDTCFKCVNPERKQYTASSCALKPSYVYEDDEEEEERCHVDRYGLPVCKNHIDVHDLDIPVFEPGAGDAVNFMDKWGFVVMNTDRTPEQCEADQELLVKLIGDRNEYDFESMSEKIKEDNWDSALSWAGQDTREFGVVCPGKGEEGDPLFKMKKDSYESVLQSPDVWDVRKSITPCVTPFFSDTDNVTANMSPYIVIPKNTDTTKDSLRSMLHEKRLTNTRDEKEASSKHRSSALKIVNGIIPFVDTAWDNCHVEVMVCPESWNATKTVDGEKVTTHFNFNDIWSECVPREEAHGIFPDTFRLNGLTIPVSLKRGQVVLFRRTRPFSLHKGKDNFFGMFVGACNITPKTSTTDSRIKMALNNLVKRKEYNHTQYRYPQSLCAKQDENVSMAMFDNNLRPFTYQDMEFYAAELMGTKHVNPATWPSQYIPKTRTFEAEVEEKMNSIDGDDDDEVMMAAMADDDDAAATKKVVTDKASKIKKEREVANAKRKKALSTKNKIVKKSGAAAEGIEEHKHVAAVTKKITTKKEPQVSKDKEEEEDDEDPSSGVAQQQQQQQKKKAVILPKKKKDATPANVWVPPIVDPEEAEEIQETLAAPTAIKFRNDFFEEHEDDLPGGASYFFVGSSGTKPDLQTIDDASDVIVAPLGNGCDAMLFDAFNALNYDDNVQEELRQFMIDHANRERAEQKTPNGLRPAGRVISAFGRVVKSGNDKHAPEDMPNCIEHLLERANAYLGEGRDEDEFHPFNQVVMYSTCRKKDTVNEVKCADLEDGSHVLLIPIGDSSRSIRFRGYGPEGITDGSKKTSKKRSPILCDLKAYSGMGVLLSPEFHDLDTHSSYELPARSGASKDDEVDAPPMSLLVLCTTTNSADVNVSRTEAGRKREARKKKAKSATPSAAEARRKKAAAAAAKSDGLKTHAEMRDEFEVYKTTYASKLGKGTVARTLFKEMCMSSVDAAKTGNVDDLKYYREKCGEVYRALTGEEWDPRSPNAPHPDDHDDDDNDSLEEMMEEAKPSVPPKKSKPSGGGGSKLVKPKKPNADSKTMEKVAHPKPAPIVMDSHKTVVRDGKVAKRSTRERKPVVSKRDIAEAESGRLIQQNWKRYNSRRKKKGLMPMSLTQYKKTVEGGKGSIVRGNARQYDEEEDGDDEEDGDFDEDEDIIDESGESDDEEDDSDDEGHVLGDSEDAEILVRIDNASEKFDILYNCSSFLVEDGPDKVKSLAKLHKNAYSAVVLCQRVINADTADSLEMKVAAFESALIKYAEDNPDSGVVIPGHKTSKKLKQSTLTGGGSNKKKRERQDDDDGGEAERKELLIDHGGGQVVIEGWQPKLNTELADTFVDTLIGVALLLSDQHRGHSLDPVVERFRKDIERFQDKKNLHRFNDKTVKMFVEKDAPLFLSVMEEQFHQEARRRAETRFAQKEDDGGLEKMDLSGDNEEEEIVEEEEEVVEEEEEEEEEASSPPVVPQEKSKKRPVEDEEEEEEVIEDEEEEQVEEDAPEVAEEKEETKKSVPSPKKKAKQQEEDEEEEPKDSLEKEAEQEVQDEEENEEEDEAAEVALRQQREEEVEMEEEEEEEEEDEEEEEGGGDEDSAKEASRDRQKVSKPTSPIKDNKKRERESSASSLDVDVLPEEAPASTKKSPKKATASTQTGPFIVVMGDKVFTVCATADYAHNSARSHLLPDGNENTINGHDVDSLYSVRAAPPDWKQKLLAANKEPIPLNLKRLKVAEIWPDAQENKK